MEWNQEDQPSHDEALIKLADRIHPGAIVLLHSTSQTYGGLWIMDELLARWEEMEYIASDCCRILSRNDISCLVSPVSG